MSKTDTPNDPRPFTPLADSELDEVSGGWLPTGIPGYSVPRPHLPRPTGLLGYNGNVELK